MTRPIQEGDFVLYEPLPGLVQHWHVEDIISGLAWIVAKDGEDKWVPVAELVRAR